MKQSLDPNSVFFTKLPHAGMVVEDSSARLVFDPILGEQIVQTTYIISPAVTTSKEALRVAKIDAIFISHEHEDHFNLESLDLFPRNVRVYIPEGAVLVTLLLKKLGFESITSLWPGVPVEIGNFTVIPTASNVSFPEVGFIVKKGGITIWNLVDTLPLTSELEKLLAEHGPPTLLLPYYQPTQELKVSGLQILDRFPRAELAKHVLRVVKLCPVWILPSSYDIFNFKRPWINLYLAPISRKEFIEEVQRHLPDVRSLCLDVGEKICFLNQAGEFERQLERPAWLFEVKRHNTDEFFFADETSNMTKVKAQAMRWLKRDFIQMVRNDLNRDALIDCRKRRYKWTLQLRSLSTRDDYLLFDFFHLEWNKVTKPEGSVSAITTKDLVDYSEGKCSTYGLICGGLLNFNDEVALEPLTRFSSSFTSRTRLTERLHKLGYSWNGASSVK